MSKKKRLLKTILIIIAVIVGIYMAIAIATIVFSDDEGDASSNYNNSSIEWVTGSDSPVEDCQALKMKPDEFANRFNNANKNFLGSKYDDSFVYNYLTEVENYDESKDLSFTNYVYVPDDNNSGIYIQVVNDYIIGAYSIYNNDGTADISTMGNVLSLQISFILEAMGENIENHQTTANHIYDLIVDCDGQFSYGDYSMVLSKSESDSNIIQIFVYKK